MQVCYTFNLFNTAVPNLSGFDISNSLSLFDCFFKLQIISLNYKYKWIIQIFRLNSRFILKENKTNFSIKVFAVAFYNSEPSFEQLMNSILEKCCVCGHHEVIEPFSDLSIFWFVESDRTRCIASTGSGNPKALS